MDLPDCPPGAEGYDDTVIEVAKKIENEDASGCTKAEREFLEHLSSLRIKLEDGTTRCMVERRGRDVSGKWIYLCFPCAAVCSGESILQTHISGKKHKNKLAVHNYWSPNIFEEHPYVKTEKGESSKSGLTEDALQKMAAVVDLHNKDNAELEARYGKFRNIPCDIQSTLLNVKSPLLGIEYLVEFPPEEDHHEPRLLCVLCDKQGHRRTILNHLTSYGHRFIYLRRHFTKAANLITPIYRQQGYREAVEVIMNRLAHRIEEKYGRLKPLCIEANIFEAEKDKICQWICKSHHFHEVEGQTFEEIVDANLMNYIMSSKEEAKDQRAFGFGKIKDNERGGARETSLEPVSEDNGEEHGRNSDRFKIRSRQENSNRFEPYAKKTRTSPFKSKYVLRNVPENPTAQLDKSKAPNFEYKKGLAVDKIKMAEASAKRTLLYHEKNPEKHPQYPEEWKKFWNKRYKEIQAEGKEPSKHDFKPEWIVFWTNRMKELHEKELQVIISEIYRKLNLSPSDLQTKSSVSPRRSIDIKTMPRRWSPPRLRSPLGRKQSPYERKWSPGGRQRSPGSRQRSPGGRQRSPGGRPRSPGRRLRSPGAGSRSPGERQRSPGGRHRSPGGRRRSPVGRQRSPHMRGWSPVPYRKSPDYRQLKTNKHSKSRSPLHRYRRSPTKPHIELESLQRSESPLSRRAAQLRNRSPEHHKPPAAMLETVLVSDDELNSLGDNLSPWNSDSLDSLGSLPDVTSPYRAKTHHGGSSISHNSKSQKSFSYSRGPVAEPMGPPDTVVATLRLLVALEDYLGSMGPKIVDLLTEALKMEKEKANSSEDMMDQDLLVTLLETAKEKLKGALQAGLVPGTAVQAVRTAIVRTAGLLHEADQRAKKQKQMIGTTKAPKDPLAVAGVGAVDKAEIAKQMAAALIAQGKTDVTSEELAQLVDAVVGMAEAKQREAALGKSTAVGAPPPKPVVIASASTKSGSALQLLQSAYDEKKVEKQDTPDAMDGLSDGDLETLLKNFNELSAEEQHSLIAYLKKLEAKNPRRVERLREYVSAAPHPLAQPSPQKEASSVKTVTLESDDDDYTVEEVFMSATKKVKENQIRQEMEVVKKSLLEAKSFDSDSLVESLELPVVGQTVSSAANLLAMVHASIQAKSTKLDQTASIVNEKTQNVEINTEPRSYGDISEQVVVREFSALSRENATLLPGAMRQEAIVNKATTSLPNFHDNSQNMANFPIFKELNAKMDSRDQINVQSPQEGISNPTSRTQPLYQHRQEEISHMDIRNPQNNVNMFPKNQPQNNTSHEEDTFPRNQPQNNPSQEDGMFNRNQPQFHSTHGGRPNMPSRNQVQYQNPQESIPINASRGNQQFPQEYANVNLRNQSDLHSAHNRQMPQNESFRHGNQWEVRQQMPNNVSSRQPLLTYPDTVQEDSNYNSNYHSEHFRNGPPQLAQRDNFGWGSQQNMNQDYGNNQRYNPRGRGGVNQRGQGRRGYY